MLKSGSLNKNQRIALSIGLPVLAALGLTAWAIYGVGDYGIALFILIPFMVGLSTVILYGRGEETSVGMSLKRGLLSLGIYMLVLFLFAMEGLICILMAAPLALILCVIGSLIGHAVCKQNPGRSFPSILLFLVIIPCFSFFEKDIQPALVEVTTAVEIAASRETVWKNVIEFPELPEPQELMFRAGIAYPINARITGTGVGAIRHCNFTTGSFVEPITTWDEGHLLQFTVEQHPASMKEISFWDVNAPHLHDYFVSQKGQFKLTTLPNGNTRLEGTTWYYHDIRPAFYWRLWSNYIVHAIHKRVLHHIKRNAESEPKNSMKTP